MSTHSLEPATQKFADATSTPPFLYELGADCARKVLDDLQAARSPSSTSTKSESSSQRPSATSGFGS